MIESWRMLLVLWMGLLGSCVGSFLNVVIYRVPRAMSLIRPGSHCPECGRAIRWYHNVPVLGWLVLGGRCHDCHLAIPVRYPLIEAVTAVMFAVVAWRGPLAAAGAATMPLGTAPSLGPVSGWWWCTYELVLLCALLVLACVQWDGAPAAPTAFPWSLVVAPGAAGMLIPPVGWAWRAAMAGGIPPVGTAAPWLACWVRTFAVGGVTAAGFGVVCWPALSAGSAGGRGRRLGAGSLLLVGVFLGGPAVSVLAPATALCQLGATAVARRVLARRGAPWSPLLFVLTLAWIVVGGPGFDVWPPWSPWQTALAGAGLVLVSGLLALATWTLVVCSD